jgi:hypothetical protein
MSLKSFHIQPFFDVPGGRRRFYRACAYYTNIPHTWPDLIIKINTKLNL